MAKLLQTKISESDVTLPATVVYAALLWIAAGLITSSLYLQFALFALNTALMMELNNRNALLRIRSRMVSVSFIIISCMTNFVFADITACVTGLGVAAMLMLLFMQYQDNMARGMTFYTFVTIGIMSLLWIQILFFVPIVWLLMLFYIQNMSRFTFAASLLGLIAPYWFAGAYFLFINDFETPVVHIMHITEFVQIPAAYSNISLNQIVTLVMIVTLAFIGGTHYVLYSYNDKIHNRMLYTCFMWLDVAALAFIVLQPQHYNQLIVMMTVFTSPLLAHFVALTKTRWTNITTMVIAALALMITIFNLWTPSLIFSQVTAI